MHKLIIEKVEYGSEAYDELLRLTNKVLRAPIGLSIYDENLEIDRSSIHVVGRIDGEVVACCAVSPISGYKAKLKHMAVDEKCRGQGVGSRLLEFIEFTSKEKGYKELTAHTRVHIIEFYQNNGWKVISDEFTELSSQVVVMSKHLD